MQAGFGLLEVGSIRSKNAQNVLLKNIIDGCAAALAYWATGFGLALGEGGNPFLDKTYFFLIGYNDEMVYFFFFYVVAGTTATIVSGAVAERCRFRAYMIYTFVLTGFIYPVCSHWIWSSAGFLYGHVIDYAAGGAVHVVGEITDMYMYCLRFANLSIIRYVSCSLDLWNPCSFLLFII